MQPPRATLLLAALLVLLPARAPGSDAPRRPKPVWGHLRLRGRPGQSPRASDPVVRTVRTALNYYNYQQGSPSSDWVLTYIKKASVKTIPGVGHKYLVQFATKDAVTQDQDVCVASVSYVKSRPKPAVKIHCSSRKDSSQHWQQDYNLYLLLKETLKIPSNYLQSFATLGSSFIAWEKSSEDQGYSLADIKNVQLRKRADDSLDCEFSVVLIEDSEATTISCDMSFIWKPGQNVQVKYKCPSEDNSSESGDGSGEELGSTEFLVDSENNF